MSDSFRKNIIISLCLLLLVFSGCTKTNKPQDNQQVPPQNEIEVEKPKPTVIKEKDKFEVIESDQIPGWKKLKARVSLNELSEYGSQSIDDNKMVEFSIHFPGNWTLDSTVFYDSNNKKVAEIPPAILFKAGQEPIFLDYQPNKDFGEELVSKEQIQIKSYKGSKIITKMPTESGSWYPHMYHLTDQTHGFKIFFYSKVISKTDQELFDIIVKTFNFGQ